LRSIGIGEERQRRIGLLGANARFPNDFSWQLIEMVPMPFLVTGAACAREGIRQRLPLAKRLLVNNLLEFDLDFRAGVLRRIILHLPHPVAGFYTDGKTKQSMGELLDGGLNFMLWLVRQETCPDLFRKQYADGRNNLLHKCALLFIDYLRIYTNLYKGQHLSALYTPIDEGNMRRVGSFDSTSTHHLSFLGRNDTSSKILVTLSTAVFL